MLAMKRGLGAMAHVHSGTDRNLTRLKQRGTVGCGMLRMCSEHMVPGTCSCVSLVMHNLARSGMLSRIPNDRQRCICIVTHIARCTVKGATTQSTKRHQAAGHERAMPAVLAVAPVTPDTVACSAHLLPQAITLLPLAPCLCRWLSRVACCSCAACSSASRLHPDLRLHRR